MAWISKPCPLTPVPTITFEPGLSYLRLVASGWCAGRPPAAPSAEAYRRRRRRIATVAAGVLGSVVLPVPGVLAAVALYQAIPRDSQVSARACRTS